MDTRRPFLYGSGMPQPTPPTETEVLRRVTVRLLRDDERAAFDQALEAKHYLAHGRLAGQTAR